EDKCHGCALQAAVGGDELVLVTHGRLRMVTAQTPGADVKSPHAGADVGQPPDENGGGQVVGFAVEEYLIVVNISATSTSPL
ncbi:unnamed protein product, partial [marine sediment metagenome]